MPGGVLRANDRMSKALQLVAKLVYGADRQQKNMPIEQRGERAVGQIKLGWHVEGQDRRNAGFGVSASRSSERTGCGVGVGWG